MAIEILDELTFSRGAVGDMAIAIKNTFTYDITYIIVNIEDPYNTFDKFVVQGIREDWGHAGPISCLNQWSWDGSLYYWLGTRWDWAGLTTFKNWELKLASGQVGHILATYKVKDNAPLGTRYLKWKFRYSKY